MSDAIKSIAARYASALKRSEVFSSPSARVRPTLLDIWLWKLEEVALGVAVKYRRDRPDPAKEYDHFYLYAHRFCLNGVEDVRRAPDSVLFEALRLDGSMWGWLQFMVRELGWHSMIAANWGLPVLVIPDGVEYEAVSEAARRAQAVAYFLELMRERGRDLLAETRSTVASLKAGYGGEDFDAWLCDHHEWLSYVHLYGDSPNPAALLSKETEPRYPAGHADAFCAEIRAAAERRREVWDAEWSCDCAGRERGEREAAPPLDEAPPVPRARVPAAPPPDASPPGNNPRRLPWELDD